AAYAGGRDVEAEPQGAGGFVDGEEEAVRRGKYRLTRDVVAVIGGVGADHSREGCREAVDVLRTPYRLAVLEPGEDHLHGTELADEIAAQQHDEVSPGAACNEVLAELPAPGANRQNIVTRY